MEIVVRRPGFLVAAGLAAVLPVLLQGARMLAVLSTDAGPADPTGALFLAMFTLALWCSFVVALFTYRRTKGLGAVSALMVLMLLWIVELGISLGRALADSPGYLDPNLVLYTAAPGLLTLLTLTLFLYDLVRRKRAGFATLLMGWLSFGYCLLLFLGTLGDLLDRTWPILAAPASLAPFYSCFLLLPVLLFALATSKKEPAELLDGDAPGQEVYLANRESRMVDLTHPR